MLPLTTDLDRNRSGQLITSAVLAAAAILLGYLYAPMAAQFIINHFFTAKE